MRFASITRSVFLVVPLIAAAGCGSKAERGRTMRPPRQPPGYPAAMAAPLDPSLRLKARQELESDLKSNDPGVRSHALVALINLPEGNHDEVLAHLHDPAPNVRFAAVMGTGQLKKEVAYRDLIAMAGDPDRNVQVAVRYALHRLGDTHLSHDLEQFAKDPDPALRGNTALVLGLLGEPSALRILRVLRLDSNAAVRQEASQAMWQLGDEQGLEDLAGLSVSRYPDDEMIGLLGMAAPRRHIVIQNIRGGLVSDWPEVSLVAARAMGLLDSDEGYGVALQGVKSSDPLQRGLAAMALGAIRRPDAQPLLRPLLSDSDANVRIAAAAAVLQLKE